MIYLLKNKNPSFGTMIECVVRTSSEKKARELASTKAYGEGASIWKNSELSSCEVIFVNDKEEVISTSVAE